MNKLRDTMWSDVLKIHESHYGLQSTKTFEILHLDPDSLEFGEQYHKFGTDDRYYLSVVSYDGNDVYSITFETRRVTVDES